PPAPLRDHASFRPTLPRARERAARPHPTRPAETIAAAHSPSRGRRCARGPRLRASAGPALRRPHRRAPPAHRYRASWSGYSSVQGPFNARSFQQALVVGGGTAEKQLRGLGTAEVQVGRVLPGEADTAVHL